METSSSTPAAEALELAAAPSPPPAAAARAAAMELPGDVAGAAEDAAGIWDWGNLLDFTIEDDHLIMPWEQEDRPTPPPQSPAPPIPPSPLQKSSPGSSIHSSTTAAANKAAAGAVGRVRKRDPKLLCENFLAGRVPCSCPEEDEKDEEDEEAMGTVPGGGRKKVRAGGVAAIARCQVSGCGADIRELKGYHRRHRVCLRCANATSVFLEGEAKRYCQQCGKFHILSDFDEGKRSCRRKLERHNKRRRRRLIDHRNVMESEKESPGILPAGAACDEEPRKANIELSNGIAGGVDNAFGNKSIDTETSLEPEDEQGSPVVSVPSLHTVQSNSMLSFAASGETQMEERIDNTKSAISSSFCGNKGAYSSMCPTGRVSFKLYDWNPADFPRRLRHQIFQWLANMPVELEGYIRPGCTILTLFIAMPQSMWDKLSKESAVYVNNFVKAPQCLFSGRGNMLIYLNNKIFQVNKDGTLLANIKMEVQVPRLHYVHPNCFEAGKPVELIACGSNLLRHKFRFLMSCSGKYLHNEFCGVVSRGMIKPCHKIGDDLHNSDHQILLIRIHNTEPDMFGPAFIEVENECGISNFIPVLFGERNVYTEMMRLQGSSSDALCTDIISQTAEAGAIPCLCDHFVSSQTSKSDLLLDIAWFLKAPTLDKNEMLSSSMHIQRLSSLLKHLLQNESFSILEKVLGYLDILIEGKDLNEPTNTLSDPEVEFFLAYVNYAKNILYQKRQINGNFGLDSEYSNAKGVCGQDGDSRVREPHALDSINQETKETIDRQAIKDRSPKDSEENIALLNKDITHCPACYPHLASKWQQDSWFHMLSRRITSTRLALFVMVSVVTCCGICVALLHPRQAGDFVVTVRRCLFGVSDSHR